MSISDITGLSGHALLLAAIIIRMARAINIGARFHHQLTAVLIILALISFGAFSATEISRGIFGDLSITTMILLGRYLFLPESSPVESRRLFILTTTAGLLFYPFALGIGMIDPYQWGYLNGFRGIVTPLLFLAGIAGLMIFAMRIRSTLIMACIAVALAGFTLGILESGNIWDYLMDPMLFIYGLVSLCVYLLKQLFGFYRGKKYNPS